MSSSDEDSKIDLLDGASAVKKKLSKVRTLDYYALLETITKTTITECK